MSHVVSDMCQFDQRSRMFRCRNGQLKFSGSGIPISLAVPIARSEYPEKSK